MELRLYQQHPFAQSNDRAPRRKISPTTLAKFEKCAIGFLERVQQLTSPIQKTAALGAAHKGGKPELDRAGQTKKTKE
jgi:hypothetical protein